MAEDTAQERTEQPSGKRLEESRKKGQIARSRELNTFFLLLASASGLIFLGDRIALGLMGMMREQFRLERATIFDPHAPILRLQQAMSEAFVLLAPLLGLLVVVAVLSPLVMGGWSFSSEALLPKWEKLDPLRGFGRMFSLRGLVELVKSLLKFLVVLFATGLVFAQDFEDMLRLGDETVLPAVVHSGELLVHGFLYLSVSVALIAALDVPYQLWDYKRHLRMTRQEVRDEMKETDGRPEVKARIRRLQMEVAQRRMMEDVPNADVVLTNPTHFAVALKYDQSRASAPIVVAKGRGLVAGRIRDAAKSAGVPLVAAPSLTRALYYSTKLGERIPEGLYLAVAQVLAYVYQLKAARQSGQPVPEPPHDLPVPDDLARPAE